MNISKEEYIKRLNRKIENDLRINRFHAELDGRICTTVVRREVPIKIFDRKNKKDNEQ